MLRGTSLLLLAGLSAAAATAQADSTLPEGTVLPVIFETTVSSAASRAEDKVLAKVREDVRLDGRVVIPAGSELRGHVTTARRSGKVKGQAYLALRFTELSMDGKTYTVSTATVSKLAPKTHEKDTKVIAGSAVAGALVGAVADGGKGAAIGAVVGGGAGTGVVVATRGEEVSLPSGTRWRVRLTRPLSLD
jgi:hypothetical protein